MTTTINASLSGGLIQQADTSGILALQTAGTTAVTISAAQKVGIGTTSVYGTGSPLSILGSPTAGQTSLVISDGATATIGLALGTPSASTVPYLFSNVSLALGTNGAERMRIDTSGNVGIGTASPTSKLHLAVSAASENVIALTGSTTAATYTQYSNTGGSFYVGIDNSAGSSFGSAYSANLYYGGAYPMIFWTNNTERMRITGSGGFLIKCTAPPSASVFGSAFLDNGVGASVLHQSTSITSANALQAFYNPNGNVGSVGTSGSNAYYATTSDYRLKENIAPMTGALNKVALLKPCTYTWKASQEDSQGFIAHELAEVCPQAVIGEKDAVDEDGNIKPQNIDTSFLVATLTAAIQEQQALITQLQADVAALKAK